MTESPPRLSVAITEEQANGLSRIPHGTKKAIFHAIIDDLNKMMDDQGDLAIAAIACHAYKFSNKIMKSLEE